MADDLHLVKLYLTDKQYTRLRHIVMRELVKAEVQHSKLQPTEKKRNAVDNAVTDWKDINTSLADNVW